MKYILFILKKVAVLKPGLYIVLRVLLVIKNIAKIYIMQKGFLPKVLVTDVSKKIDKDINVSKIKVVGPIIELFDDKLFHFGLTYLDDKWGEKVPEKARPAIITLLEAYSYGTWEKVTDEVVAAVNAFVDIPLVDEDFEGNLIKGVVDAILKLIKS